MSRRGLILVTVVLALTACRPEAARQPSPPTPTATAARVVAVLDGDTIDVQLGAKRQRVRLLGIDAPEVAHDTAAQCGADAATASLDTLAYGQTVTLQHDPTADAHDRFGRLLAYAEVGGLDLGAVQVERGYAAAWHPRSAPAPARFEAYREAAEKARAKRRGAWGTCSTVGR